MLPQQQCLSCNALVTSPSRSCACGHVLESASRFIDGKRFTEYRAKMRSCLENKRIKKKVRGKGNRKYKRLNSLEKNQPTERNSTLFKSKRQPNPRNKGRSSKSLRKNVSSASAVQQQESICVPPELLTRFPSALQEINRRIMGQNIIWLLLI